MTFFPIRVPQRAGRSYSLAPLLSLLSLQTMGHCGSKADAAVNMAASEQKQRRPSTLSAENSDTMRSADTLLYARRALLICEVAPRVRMLFLC